MAKAEPAQKLILRDQRRALHAYEAMSAVAKDDRDEYRTAVNDFGANILRSGLCAALAAIQRLGKRGGDVLMGHLATAGVPGLESVPPQELARRVREMDADSYMIATREMLRVATWLKRAVQATLEGA